jgi:SAM-dependent methyltransferase
LLSLPVVSSLFERQGIMIGHMLQHPLTRGRSVDDPWTTQLRRQIIASKPFLRSIYREWYALILDALGERQRVLELGSGAGFFKDLCSGAITSEILLTPGVDLIADACALPFADSSLDAIAMTDVFHHIPDVSRFLVEAQRCLVLGGKLLMVEPWRTPWSGWVYSHLHPEPFEPTAAWEIPSTGPLSGANGALPWIVFKRDRARFRRQFPRWRVVRIAPMMPISYLLSGGVSMRSFAPGWLYRSVRALESGLSQDRWAMFALIELELSP